MKRSHRGGLWLCARRPGTPALVFAAVAAVAGPSGPVGAASVTGTVQLTHRGKGLAAEQIMVAMEPADGSVDRKAASPQTHVVDMKNKVYVPRYLIVSAGDKVIFENSDPFKHNVFSASKYHRFDLGSYGKDTRPHRVFSEVGLAEIYCNVHPEMACFIMISKGSWQTITGPAGRFSFSEVPAGIF
jgi:plastocyanin